MDAPGIVPSSIHCHACGATIVLAGHEGFTHVDCPDCGALSVVPLKFGNYLLLHPVGIGGVGTVYKAMDLALNRFVALKILRKKLATNPEFIENFVREARSAASISHPNVAQVYSFGEMEGQYYLAMEIMERGSLDDRMTKLGKIPERDVLEIAIAVAYGLRAAHQRGLLHRDVKPGNILFNTDGVPKIVDFGLARPPTTEKTAGKNEPIWGTPYYIAPEKLRGQSEDVQSDIYSLGATIFHAVAGRPPYEGESAYQVATKHANLPAVSLKAFVPAIHERTAQVIGRMLAKNPAERFASYDELIHDLELALDDLKKIETDRVIVIASGERFSIHSVIITASALAICGVMAWLVWWWLSRSAPIPPEPLPGTNETVMVVLPPPPPDVDFNEVLDDGFRPIWLAQWDDAGRALNEIAFDDAYADLGRALKQNESNPVWKRWMHFYLGLTYSADTRTYVRDAALASFRMALDSETSPAASLPETITPANFVSIISRAMLEPAAMESLWSQRTILPPWAQALTILCRGLQLQHNHQFADAIPLYQSYRALNVEPQHRWSANLPKLASHLIERNQQTITSLAQLDALIAQNQFEQASNWVANIASNPPLPDLPFAAESRRPLIRAGLDAIEAQRQRERDEAERKRQEAERLRQEQERLRLEAERRKRIEEENKVTEAAGVALAPLWQAYDFHGVIARLESLSTQITTPEARQKLHLAIAIPGRLIEWRDTLVTDINSQPYPGEVVDAAGRSLPGQLTRATATEIILKIPYGETRARWTDLTPGMVTRIADHYLRSLAASEPAEAMARRHFGLALFCKQFNQDKLAANYAAQAMRLHPAMRQDIQDLLGPLAP